MNPDQYCQEKCAASGSSFYYSFLFLPPERRQAIMALYAFCREVDDIVDECTDISIASTKLVWWRMEVERIAEKQATHPVGLALQAVAPGINLPKEQLLEIIDGMEMDLQQSRYLDFKGLSLYCYRVASVVGLLAAEIFGYPTADAEIRARSRHGLPAHQHHPRCGRRRPARPHLPANG
jgi:15-cis-phytoene synthase